MMFLVLEKCLILVVVVLVSVSFMTLFERKMLSYIQMRKGPEKSGFKGLFQPFSDAIKLFSKLSLHSKQKMFFVNLFSPTLMLIGVLLTWTIYPSVYSCVEMKHELLFFFCCLSSGVYASIMAGWSSNCMYSMLGAVRSVAQTVSYEVSFFFFFLGLIMMFDTFSLIEMKSMEKGVEVFFHPVLFISLFFCCLAESGRTPFDFAEGESELVSGYNTEYGGVMFAFFFLSEYGMIILLSYLLSYVFLNVWFFPSLLLIFVWIRGCLPRFRFDLLMEYSWMLILPVSVFYLILFTSMFVSS